MLIHEGIRLSALLLVTLALGLAQSQTKASLNGTWKMDPAKSDFGAGPVSASRLDKISYEEPNLKDTITQRLKGPEATYDMNYTTDGKECSNKALGRMVTSTAHWEGDELVIDSKVHALIDQNMHDRYRLSADGRTLTLQRHMTGRFDTDQKIVFDRQ